MKKMLALVLVLLLSLSAGAFAQPDVCYIGVALDTVAGFFKVLGDGTRMRIISALAVRELCVCDIAAALGMTKSAVSHQLGTLRTARLVKCRREGKSVFYSIDDDHVYKMLEGGLEHVHE